MKVYLIGAGPGDPGLFTLKGKDVMGKSDVVVYDHLADKSLLEHARKDVNLFTWAKKAVTTPFPKMGSTP